MLIFPAASEWRMKCCGVFTLLFIGRKNSSVTLRMKLYEGTFHGFAIRGDARDPKIQTARQDGVPALQLCCVVFHGHKCEILQS